MTTTAFQFLWILVTYIVIDFVYLSSVFQALYKPGFGALFANNNAWWKIMFGAFAWVALTIGQVYFVKPTIQNTHDSWEVLSKGALFGFIVYAVYNATNLATLKNIDPKMCLLDTLWGTTLSAIIAHLHFAH